MRAFLIVLLGDIYRFGALKEARHRRVTLEPAKPDTYDWPLFAFYLAFYFAAIYWTGPHIVSFVVSHGIVLTWAN